MRTTCTFTVKNVPMTDVLIKPCEKTICNMCNQPYARDTESLIINSKTKQHTGWISKYCNLELITIKHHLSMYASKCSILQNTFYQKCGILHVP